MMDETRQGEGSGTSGSAIRAGAVLTVDLGAIRANYRILRQELGRAECAGVVKADAYGLGAAEVATALTAEGCRSFFVAHLDEAIDLNPILPASSRLYVLNGLPPGAEDEAQAAGVIPVLNSLDEIEAWAALGARLGRKLKAALQVDSGMARLGLQPADVAWLAEHPKPLARLDVGLVMSHLACADTPDHPANAAQRRAFEALRLSLPEAPASLANSSGIFLGAGYHFDLARPGAALYGINPHPGRPNPMRSVVRIAAKVIQTRAVEPGDGIGYGHSAIARVPKNLATLSIGYGDGWMRAASSGAAAFWQEHRLPFIGRVSMDSIIIDISDLPSGALRPGTLLDLVTEQQSIDDIAALAGTIGYEILTGLGSRYFRSYIGH